MKKVPSLFALFSLLVLMSGCSAQPPQASSQAQLSSQQDNSTLKKAANVSHPVVAPEPEEAVIEIDFGGFHPPNVYISPGTAVRFINLDKREHWPASNPYPTHTDYPGFDAGHGLRQGESYYFVFDRKGQWGYHDHNNQAFGGTIEVN